VRHQKIQKWFTTVTTADNGCCCSLLERFVSGFADDLHGGITGLCFCECRILSTPTLHVVASGWTLNAIPEIIQYASKIIAHNYWLQNGI